MRTATILIAQQSSLMKVEILTEAWRLCLSISHYPMKYDESNELSYADNKGNNEADYSG